MERKNCMGNYWGTCYGRLQVYYLSSALHLNIDQIMQITEYSPVTIEKYLREKTKEKEQEALETFYSKDYFLEYNDFYPMYTFSFENSSNGIFPDEDYEEGKFFAYLMEIYRNNIRLFLKVGSTKNLEQRAAALSRNKKYDSDYAYVKKFYSFDTEEEALTMENILRNYYKEKNNCEDYIKQDRFSEQLVEEKDLNFFEKKAICIKELFKKA